MTSLGHRNKPTVNAAKDVTIACVTNANEQIITYLCAELNATETVFPGTDLRLIYQIGDSC
jgi:hypothetical protein